MNQTFSLRPFFPDDPILAEQWQQQAALSPVFLSWDWQALMKKQGGASTQALVLMHGNVPLAMLSGIQVRRHGFVSVR